LGYCVSSVQGVDCQGLERAYWCVNELEILNTVVIQIDGQFVIWRYLNIGGGEDNPGLGGRYQS
jgi:hypothetical protein